MEKIYRNFVAGEKRNKMHFIVVYSCVKPEIQNQNFRLLQFCKFEDRISIKEAAVV